MKKTKLFTFLALGLAAVMLLASCAPAAQLPIRDMLLTDEDFEAYAPSYTTGDTVSGLTSDMEFVKSAGDLVYFTRFTGEIPFSFLEHIVYDMKREAVVFRETNSLLRSVDLFSLSDSYFTVTYAHYAAEAPDELSPNPVEYRKTAIYSTEGTLVAEARDETAIHIAEDLLYLNGACYRYGDGKIEKAFDYSPLASIPDIAAKSEKYYYEITKASDATTDKSSIKVYDLELNPVSYFSLPSYAISVIYHVLSDGNLYVQYFYILPDDAEEYDLLDSGKKYNIVKGIVSAADASFTELEGDYIFNLLQYWENTVEYGFLSGIRTDGLLICGSGYSIENKLISSREEFFFMRNDGSVFTVDVAVGSKFKGCYKIAENRFVVKTVDEKSYLVNEKGELIGDITKSLVCGSFIYGKGVIYDTDLSPLYNYAENGMSLSNTLSNALVLKKGDALYIYNGTSNPTYLADPDSDRTVIYSASEYLIVKDSSASSFDSYEIYNGNGAKILTVNVDKDSLLSLTALTVIAAGEDTLLFKVTDSQGGTAFYTVK